MSVFTPDEHGSPGRTGDTGKGFIHKLLFIRVYLW